MKRTFLMASVLLLAFTSVATAQSYDCRKAVTPDEVAVCSNTLLGELDDVQADLYRRLRHYTMNFDNAMGLQAQLRNEARAFLRRRAACGADPVCLEKVYRTRIRQLLKRWLRAMGDVEAERSGDAAESERHFSCRSPDMSVRARHKMQCPDAPDDPEVIQTWILGDGRAICALPCFMGAYNIVTHAYLVDTDNGTLIRQLSFPMQENGKLIRMEEIVSPSFDAMTRIVMSFNRGRGLGDCGVQYRWQWDGLRFQLVEQRKKDQCDGKPGPWHQVYPK